MKIKSEHTSGDKVMDDAVNSRISGRRHWERHVGAFSPKGPRLQVWSKKMEL